MKQNERSLMVGDIVQINPLVHHDGFFAGCLMMVTEPKAFGAQGFIAMPGERGTIPSRAFYRASWAEMEYVGRATFVPGDVVTEDDEP